MTNLFNQLSIRSRLIIMLIIVTVISSLIVGLLGWRNGHIALNATIFNQLNSVRVNQTYQVENYFRNIFSQTRTLAEDRMIVNAMKQFREGYDNGLYSSLSEEQNTAVSEFYDNVFVPKIASSTSNTPLSVLYQPNRSVTRYFQYHYVVDNVFPLGSKDELVESADDTTIYARFHKFYHPILRNLLKEFNYYDIFLIDIKSLSLVYSVSKEVDFATNLQDGPHRESGLGVLANQIKEKPQRGEAVIVDYRTYVPSYGAPASFVGAPIFDQNEAVGILAIQLPSDELDKLMSSNNRWVESGMGLTGESYLVGADKMMRSTSRPFSEDKTQYLATLRNYGLADTTTNNIAKYDTTILMQPVVNSSVQNALDGQSGTHIITNYLGKNVLSSYSPLNITGLNWAVISEINEDEAFKPIANLQRNILIWGVVLVLAVAFLAVLLSRYFVRPIEKLSAGVQALNAGDQNVSIGIHSNDEFGELARQFNSMTTNIRAQAKKIEQKTAENDLLLSNILPAQVSDRFRNGERIAEKHSQATVAYIELDGFGQFSKNMASTEAASVLQIIMEVIHSTGERYDVLPISALGTSCTAVCGLTSVRLDHAKRVIDFSQAVAKNIERINKDYDGKLSLRVGVDTGPILSAVIGTERFKFTVWGEAVDMAKSVNHFAPTGRILVTRDVHERVNTTHQFSAMREIQVGTITVESYELVTAVLSDQPTSESVES